jgi:hypothetical protein
MTGEAATARDQHAPRNLSGTSAPLFSSSGALSGVSPDLQADPGRLYSKTGTWPGNMSRLTRLGAAGCVDPGLRISMQDPAVFAPDRVRFFTYSEWVSPCNFGTLMEMRRSEIVKGLFSKIAESLGHDLRGVSTEAVEEVRTALTSAAIANVLERYGLSRSARRIIDLADLGAQDPDESEIDLDSLKRAVVTVLEHPHWGEPSITLRGAGLVSMEWQTRGGGTVSISFLPGNRVSYSALSAPATTADFLNIGGRHLQEEGIGNLRWFTDRIVPR